jgi:hypothetical protein
LTAKRFPLHPAHPERNCWGCERYCASSAMLCGNGSERTQHPVELFGEDWNLDAPLIAATPVAPPEQADPA